MVWIAEEDREEKGAVNFRVNWVSGYSPWLYDKIQGDTGMAQDT